MSTTTPTAFKRNPDTGLVEGLVYHRKPDGKIDWKRHINPEHIVFNAHSPNVAAEIERVYGKPAAELSYAEVISSGKEVDDRHILVLLAGYAEVAELRGYLSSVPISTNGWRSLRKSNPTDRNGARDVEDSGVSVLWQIDWLPNEEEPAGKTSGGAADATYENTGDWGYLTAMAENRSFARAVKRGLGIRILGFDEIAKKDMVVGAAVSMGVSDGPGNAPGVGSPAWTLMRSAEDANISLAVVKKLATDKYRERIKGDPAAWEKWADVETDDCATLVGLIKAGSKKAK